MHKILSVILCLGFLVGCNVGDKKVSSVYFSVRIDGTRNSFNDGSPPNDDAIDLETIDAQINNHLQSLELREALKNNLDVEYDILDRHLAVERYVSSRIYRITVSKLKNSNEERIANEILSYLADKNDSIVRINLSEPLKAERSVRRIY